MSPTYPVYHYCEGDEKCGCAEISLKEATKDAPDQVFLARMLDGTWERTVTVLPFPVVIEYAPIEKIAAFVEANLAAPERLAQGIREGRWRQ